MGTPRRPARRTRSTDVDASGSGSPDPPRDRTGPHTATPYRYSPGPSSRCRRLHPGLRWTLPPLDEGRPPDAASSPARAVPRSPADGRRAGARPARAGLLPVAALAATPVADGAATLQPTVQYEEALAHANDRIAFKAGGRVTVPFRPAAGDRWVVDGARPRALPAGRPRARRCVTPRTGRAGRATIRAAHRRADRRSRHGHRRRWGDVVVRRRPAHRRARRGGRSGSPPPRGLRLPAVLGADRQLDHARLGEDLDGRLLRRRGGRQGQPHQEEQRRIDDRRLERLDELEDDRASSTPPTPATRGSC